jgi:hypothetical protein
MWVLDGPEQQKEALNFPVVGQPIEAQFNGASVPKGLLDLRKRGSGVLSGHNGAYFVPKKHS